MPQYNLAVIVPSFNGVRFISQCLQSIVVFAQKNQTTFTTHIFFIDDGSTDTTAQTIRTLKKDLPRNILTYQYKKNGGLAAARNSGLRLLKKQYTSIAARAKTFCLFLDVDDVLLPNRIAFDSQAGLNIYGYILHGKKVSVAKAAFGTLLSRNPFVVSCIITTLHTTLFFNEQLTCLEDWEYWLRQKYLQQATISVHQDVLTAIMDSPQSMSKNLKKMTKNRVAVAKSILKIAKNRLTYKEKDLLRLHLLFQKPLSLVSLVRVMFTHGHYWLQPQFMKLIFCNIFKRNICW